MPPIGHILGTFMVDLRINWTLSNQVEVKRLFIYLVYHKIVLISCQKRLTITHNI